LGINLASPFAMVTFHPVTLENNSSAQQIEALLTVCSKHKDLNFIFTKANADAEGRTINHIIDSYNSKFSNIYAFTSLGMLRYLSCLKYASMVIGNSSSGIVEAPSFGIPTINIGDRQKGRLQSSSVYNCKPTIEDIERAIFEVDSKSFREKARETQNPYGSGDTSDHIVDIIRQNLTSDRIELKKKFYDL